MYKILIVEDDPAIAGVLKRHLATWGWEAECVADFSDVLAEFVAFDPQLVLLDISLPFYNGYHWCAEMRRVSKVPVIFISSAADNMNIVMAINMGGDDFIAKPFDLSVLIAKIQALLRRSYDFANTSPLMECGGGFMDCRAKDQGGRRKSGRDLIDIFESILERAAQLSGNLAIAQVIMPFRCLHLLLLSRSSLVLLRQ